MAPKHADQIVSTHDVVKSESDQMLYRGLTLKNGLRVLVVSDPSTDKSAAALSVQVGSLSDPKDVPGLAHFCEHMLFMGTKKYPSENHFGSFLSTHGGYSNAFTDLDQTCYYFDVTPEAFREACNIFAQFFLEPLFTQSCIDRELLAVDNEYKAYLMQDHWRTWRLQNATSDPDHDFSKFNIGSKETLQDIPKQQGIDVRQCLLDFHSKYYSSNIMNACLLGRESLDDLSDLAVDSFGGIWNKAVKAPEWPEHPFGPKKLKKQIKVVPVMESHEMWIMFPFPDMEKEHMTDPEYYIRKLVCHEGNGSLLSYLKGKNWGNALWGSHYGARGFTIFVFKMYLSPEGVDHTDEIVTALFQYLELLRREGHQEWFFEEIKKIWDLKFRFHSKRSPSSYVTAITERMPVSELKDVLSSQYLVGEYKPELIDKVMSYLSPDNVRVVLISQAFKGKTDQKEKYYDVEYSIEDIPDEKIEAWKNVGFNDNFHLPPANEFISTNFDLAPEEPEYTSAPSLLIDERGVRLWFMQDNIFKLPRSIAKFELRNSIAHENPLNACLLYMAVSCFIDAYNEYFYHATAAGLFYDIRYRFEGLTIEVGGFNEHQQALLEKVCEKLASLKINPTRFAILRERLVRQLKNFKADQPYQQAPYYLRMVLKEKFLSNEQWLSCMDQCTAERCNEFIKKFLKHVSLEGFVYGNLRSEEALDMMHAVRRILNFEDLSFEQTKNSRELKLNDGQIYEFNAINEVHNNNSITVFYQVGSLDMAEIHCIAMNELLCQILSEPCFNVLRTREQLGYLLSVAPRYSGGSYGFKVSVQSDKNPAILAERIEEFINGHSMKCLTEMSEEDFEKNKKTLLTREEPKSLAGMFSELWYEISERSYVFDRRQIEAEEIEKLTKDEVIAFFKRHVAKDGPALRQLIIKIESGSEPNERTSGVVADYIIDDIEKFKATHTLI